MWYYIGFSCAYSFVVQLATRAWLLDTPAGNLQRPSQRLLQRPSQRLQRPSQRLLQRPSQRLLLAPKGGCCIGMQEQHMLLFLNLRHELQLPGTTEHCLCEYEKTKRWMAAFDKRWPGMHLLQALAQEGDV